MYSGCAGARAHAPRAQEWWRTNCRCDAVLSLSALKGTNVATVHEWMAASIPEGPTLYPKKQVSEHPEKFFVSEIIREHVFRQYDQEVPYCVQARARAR
jgi:GTPase